MTINAETLYYFPSISLVYNLIENLQFNKREIADFFDKTSISVGAISALFYGPKANLSYLKAARKAAKSV